MKKTKIASKSATIVRNVIVRRNLDAADTKEFSKAAKTFAGKATNNKEEARNILVGLGIHTPAGKLSKRYS
jgi:hypothetical protein